MLIEEEEFRVVDDESSDDSVKIKSIDPRQVGYFVDFFF